MNSIYTIPDFEDFVNLLYCVLVNIHIAKFGNITDDMKSILPILAIFILTKNANVFLNSIVPPNK